jgi:hypothetical protein
MSDIYRQYPNELDVIYSDEYAQHIDRMTRENLRSKSDIAIELAWRDIQLAELRKDLKRLREALADQLEGSHAQEGEG